MLTITGSFGVDVEEALIIREFLMSDTPRVFGILEPIIAARRQEPADDLISVLVQAEYTDEDGVSHRLTDAEILSFAMLLMAAGSGTTWKQLGITLAAILERPDVLAAVQADRAAVRPAIEESVRWNPTDPMFSRHVTRDTEFFGVEMPQGSVLHLCLGAANHDPARWDRPDEFDISRPPKPTLAFGNGPARVPRHARRPRRDERGHHRPARPPAEPAARSRRRAPRLHRLLRTGRDRDPRRLRPRSDDTVSESETEPGYVAPELTLLGQEHIDRYRATDGEEGYLWNGATALLLTTTGRKSGEARTQPLIFAQDGDDYLVVASMGGAPQHPAWYLNLTANPEAEVQVKGDVIPVTAHTADRRREAAPLEDRHRAVAELRRVPDPYRPRDPARGAQPSMTANTARPPAADRTAAPRRAGPSGWPTARRSCSARARQIEQAHAIVAAARRLIGERGDFTTQDLVKEAGVALQTFYRIFGGKDQLLLAVFEDLIAESCVEYEQAAADLPDPIARLHFYVEVTVGAVGETSSGIAPRFVTAEHWRLHQLFPEEMAHATQHFADLVPRQLQLASDEGLLESNDPQRDAWYVTKLVMAVFHHYAYVEGPIDRPVIAEELWQFCLRALGGPPT